MEQPKTYLYRTNESILNLSNLVVVYHLICHWVASGYCHSLYMTFFVFEW